MNADLTSFSRPALALRGVGKHFKLHQQGTHIDVLDAIDLTLYPGECVVLSGPSGAGKSSLLRTIYGNYHLSRGTLTLRHEDTMLDLGTATPQQIQAVRRRTLGYVSQFLRVIPRVGTLDIVAEPLLHAGCDAAQAQREAAQLLARLNLPERLWSLPPGTFSGGEQQRVNIARGLILPRPVLLLDEPTASLDAANRQVVARLLEEARARGAAILGIFHDEDMRDRVATRLYPMQPLEAA